MGKLIRLELFNFKSYKGHHVLLFGDSYFTSIIGPNGSGKSNSMDAISFVLGIKSAHLRSTHLRDLVYRGRVLKKAHIDADGNAAEQPDGGNASDDDDDNGTQSTQRNDPQTAWVMAVYEDDAGDEQKWKRTITSTGQSEYRINGSVVNAKDYNDALEIENVLIKARNFLVFQGDVESVANQSPKDLAVLLEQISGSLECKKEYDILETEAEKATEDQTSKLNARRTINSEIKRFSEQKKEVDEYNKKADERDDAVVTHVLWKLYQFQEVIKESSAEIERIQHELKEYRRGIEKYETRLDNAKAEQTKAGREVASHERAIKKTEKAVVEKENELVPIEEKLSQSYSSREKYTKRIADVTKEKDKQAKTVEQLQKDVAIVVKAQSKWEDEWKKLAKREGRELSDVDLQEYNTLRADVNKRTSIAQTKLDSLTRQRKTDEDTVNSFKTKTEEAERQVEKFTSELEGLKEQKSSLSTQYKQMGKDIDDKKKEYNRLSSDRLKIEQKRTELDEKVAQVVNQISEAEGGRRQTAKEAQAKETLQSMKRMFKGIYGRVHELCRPKAKKYETAVSTVLGRHFDSIVVDSEKTAQQCILFLREQRIGTAAFIPLDTIQVRSLNSNLKGLHKKMSLAIDVVDYDNEVERAISFACSNAMICDDMATAKFLSFEKRVEAKAVTLDGTVIHKGGLMTGGRGPNDKGRQKVWDQAEVDKMRRILDKLMAEMSALPRAQQTITDEENIQNELSALEQRALSAKEELKALDKNIQSKQKELDHVQGQLKELRPKYNEQSSAFAKLQKKIDQTQQEVSVVEDEVFEKFCKRLKYADVRAYEAQQGSLQHEGEKKKLEFATQRTKLESQLTFEVGRMQGTESRIKNIKDASQRDEARIAELERQKEDLEEQLGELRSKVEGLQEELQKSKEAQTEKATVVAQARREMEKHSKEADSATKNITSLEAEMQRNASGRYAMLRKCKIEEIKVPVTRASAPLSSLPVDDVVEDEDPDAMEVDDEDGNTLSKPFQDYGIEVDFDELDDDLKEDSSNAQEVTLQAAITTLSAALSQVTPNMRAIERLEAATEKLAATEAEFKAARDHARDTRAAFEAIRDKRKDLFNKAFDHISTQIKPIYQSLTRSDNFPLGGRAFLDTMGADDDKPFLGGIKYHAMPPLKRFRDMDALSGGEKTIAALALLFAVHSYLPSPFFVLDEVDAALDNANVAKVARYIKEHCGPGMQFIVISLKTGLFQESQCLVGILRDQTANSSRAVTLDLRKYQPT